MHLDLPITALIQQRVSTRSYAPRPLDASDAAALGDLLAAPPPGPFAAPSRFTLAASGGGAEAAARLATYGFIHQAPNFMIGAAAEAPWWLEDFGYRLETLVLAATARGLGTCWLGGAFDRSAFGRAIGLHAGETIPAVVALGYPAEKPHLLGAAIQHTLRPRTRLGWEALFTQQANGRPLSPGAAGAYTTPLEMVRLGPSASNKQPWRVARDAGRWHFSLARTPGYREGALNRWLGIADMQRIDLGIALCHFELSARAAGLAGGWVVETPPPAAPGGRSIYVATWREA